jgi:glycosyltransferase involved in cell wall biosynthesis
MRIIDLAVIIPTLNEEYYIGELLDSLAKQNVMPKEVIVVDAESEDKTKEEVKKRIPQFPSLAFYTTPKETVAKQRNIGVSKGSASHVLFLDADMLLLQRDTLQKFWKKITAKKPDVAICYVMPLSDELKDKLLYGTGNVFATVMQPIKPMGTTMNLYVKRSVFNTIQGFDENKQQFIIHDPARKGKNYSYSRVLNALHDYNPQTKEADGEQVVLFTSSR